LTFLWDGRNFSSGRGPPNFCVGGAVGFLIESKTGRSSSFFFLRLDIRRLYQNLDRTKCISIDNQIQRIQYGLNKNQACDLIRTFAQLNPGVGLFGCRRRIIT
jgi:hypothetical protein